MSDLIKEFRRRRNRMVNCLSFVKHAERDLKNWPNSLGAKSQMETAQYRLAEAKHDLLGHPKPAPLRQITAEEGQRIFMDTVLSIPLTRKQA